MSPTPLSGADLDKAVANLVDPSTIIFRDGVPFTVNGAQFLPSTDPVIGMGIVWQFKIATFASGDQWCAILPNEETCYYSVDSGFIDVHDSDCQTGSTPWEAGCRALVAGKAAS